MKRTDMVGKLSDVLLQFGNLSKQNRDLIADVMLSECEREGMLPPSFVACSYEDFPGNEIKQRSYYVDGVSSWEPED